MVQNLKHQLRPAAQPTAFVHDALPADLHPRLFCIPMPAAPREPATHSRHAAGSPTWCGTHRRLSLDSAASCPGDRGLPVSHLTKPSRQDHSRLSNSYLLARLGLSHPSGEAHLTGHFDTEQPPGQALSAEPAQTRNSTCALRHGTAGSLNSPLALVRQLLQGRQLLPRTE